MCMATVICFVHAQRLRILNNFLFLCFGALLGWFANSWFDGVPAIQIIKPAAQITPPVVLQKTAKTLAIPAPIIKPQVAVDDYAPEHLMRKSKVAIQAGEYKQALIHIEDLLAQVQNVYPTRQIEKLFIGIAQHYLAQLGDNNPQAKIAFLGRAIDILPNELQFHHQLAQIFLSLEKYQQVQYQLSFLVNDINWKPQFDKLQAQLDYARIFEQGDIEIPLIKLTNAWHIEVVIDGKVARFILDTGASSSVVSEHLMSDNYQNLGKVVLSTANGTLDSFRAEIGEFSVGDITQKSFPVVVLPKAKLPADIDGLLGLDWLSNFDFVIDKKNSLLRLTPNVN